MTISGLDRYERFQLTRSSPFPVLLTLHILVFGEAHLLLLRILRSYARYYNDVRTHRARLASGRLAGLYREGVEPLP
jgi:hypothetical protein